jgi:hypothetical protein
MEVFILHHIHTFDNDEEDIKIIGIYSSHASATAAIERLRQQPGFCEVPEGFEISGYQVDVDHWSEGYVTMASTQDQ